MKKLYTAVDRFCARHPRFGVPDLMRWIVIGNVAVYILMLLTMRADANALAFLYLDGGKVLRGEIWRIITFIFVPASSSPFWNTSKTEKSPSLLPPRKIPIFMCSTRF